MLADDLRHRTFETVADGYDRDEVHSCLAEAADAIEDLQRTVERLTAALDRHDPAAAADVQPGPGHSAAGRAAASDPRASERALLVAVRLLIEDVSEEEVEKRLREDLEIEHTAPLIAEARKRAAQLLR
jgi:cell division septum initiation protein DivIVA